MKKNEFIGIRIPTKKMDYIKEQSQKLNMTRSEFIRRIIDAYLSINDI